MAHHMSFTIILPIITILGLSSSQSDFCIWGRAPDWNGIINGLYRYDGTKNDKPYYKKDIGEESCPVLYLFWSNANNRLLIHSSLDSSAAGGCCYARSRSFGYWNPSDSNGLWEVWNGTEMTLDSNVHAVADECPSWRCDEVSITSLCDSDGDECKGCGGPFAEHIAPNVWKNNPTGNDPDRYWFFRPDTYKWICAETYSQTCDSFYVLAVTEGWSRWTPLAEGSINLDFVWPYNKSYTVHCTNPTPVPTHNPSFSTNIPTPAPTKHPTKHPTNDPTNNPTNDPTNNPTPPTTNPSASPTNIPTPAPTKNPANNPTNDPTLSPTNNPTPHVSLHLEIENTQHAQTTEIENTVNKIEVMISITLSQCSTNCDLTKEEVERILTPYIGDDAVILNTNIVSDEIDVIIWIAATEADALDQDVIANGIQTALEDEYGDMRVEVAIRETKKPEAGTAAREDYILMVLLAVVLAVLLCISGVIIYVYRWCGNQKTKRNTKQMQSTDREVGNAKTNVIEGSAQKEDSSEEEDSSIEKMYDNGQADQTGIGTTNGNMNAVSNVEMVQRSVCVPEGDKRTDSMRSTSVLSERGCAEGVSIEEMEDNEGDKMDKTATAIIDVALVMQGSVKVTSGR